MAVQNLALPRSQALPGNVIKGGSASRQTLRQQICDQSITRQSLVTRGMYILFFMSMRKSYNFDNLGYDFHQPQV